MKETLAIVAAILAIAGNIPYLRDVLKGRAEPHAYSWFVWSVVMGINLFGQIAKGAGYGAWPTAVSWIFTVAIFLLALRFGRKNIVRQDTIFLCVALLGLIPWFVTKDPTFSVVIAVAIDLVAYAPTIRKTLQNPKTETPLLYGSNVLRHVLSLFSLQSYNIATVLHSVAMIITNLLMTAIILRGKKARESLVGKEG